MVVRAGRYESQGDVDGEREEMERGEGTDNHQMSAAALVLFAFQGDAITAPPTDVTWPSCDRS